MGFGPKRRPGSNFPDQLSQIVLLTRDSLGYAFAKARDRVMFGVKVGKL